MNQAWYKGGARSVIFGVAIRLILLVYAFTIIYPIFWTVMMSLKPNQQIFHNLWGLPQTIALDNFVRAWNASRIGSAFSNSIYVTVITNIVILVVCIPLSYTLGRMKFKGRAAIRAIIVSGLLFPSITMLLTQYIGLLRIGLVNTYTGIVSLYLAVSIAFSVFLLSNFFASIPAEFEESAQIDGCGHWRTLWLIAVPMARHGIVMLAILQVLSVWNEFAIALTVLGQDKRTIAVAVSVMMRDVRQATDWAAMFAAMVILMSLSFVIYAVFQRQISENVSMGGVKF